MSLSTAENLLRQYNKNQNKSQEPIVSSTSATKPRFGAFVYANPNDAVYDKYSTDKNFNINMWHQALATGEQDKYISLLEQNKGRLLSPQFYDPQYYDYETMMLELYQPFAPTDDKKTYYKDVYDPGTDEWKQEAIGEMNSSEYIQYQLDQIREQENAKIHKQLEQWRKDQMGWLQGLGRDALATGMELGEGILTAATGLIDFVVAPHAAAIIDKKVEGNYLDAFVEYFGSRGLTAFEKQTVRAALDEYERTHTHFKDIDGNVTGWGQYVAGISNSIGMMIPSILLAIPTGGTSLAWVGQASFYASLFSQNMYENATSPYTVGSPSWMKITNAAVTTGAEAVIEYALGKFLGGTIQNQMLGMNGGLKNFAKNITKRSAWGYVAKSAAQEGLEEYLQDFSTECINQFTSLYWKGYGKTGVTLQTLVDSFLAGALTSVLLSGGAIARNSVTRGLKNKFAKDPKTGARIPYAGDFVIEVGKNVSNKFKTNTITKRKITKSSEKLTVNKNKSTGKTFETQKLTGVKELYFKSMLREFNNAVKDLSEKKMSDKKTIALAEEVYGAFSVLSQYYSSLSPERVKNMEIFLNEVIKEEGKQEDITVDGKSPTRMYGESFANMISQQVDDAFRLAKTKYVFSNLKKTLPKVSKELKESGANNITSMTDESGESYFPEGDVEEIRKILNSSETDKYKESYKFIYTTDGRLPVEDGDNLFIPQEHLKNYTYEEVQKFFAQNRVINEFVNNSELAPMIKELIPFVKEFTKQENVDAETAVIDLLFYPSVYQAFLLYDRGKNFHTHAANLTNLHKTILDIGYGKISLDKRLSEKTKTARKAYISQLIDQIKKDTMRKPIIVAAVNWGIDPQKIRADGILNNEDKQFIRSKITRRDVIRKAAKGGPITAEYRNLAEDILPKVPESIRASVEHGLSDEATVFERAEAVCILDFFDRYGHGDIYDNLSLEPLVNKISELVDNLSSEISRDKLYAQYLVPDIKSQIIEEMQLESNSGLDLSTQIDSLQKIFDIYDFDHNISTLQTSLNDFVDELQILLEQRESVNRRAQYASQAFVIPIEASGLQPHLAQFAADKFAEFQNRYGISFKAMCTTIDYGEIYSSDIYSKNIDEDMAFYGYDTSVLNIDNYHAFAIRKMQDMLGDDYIVIKFDKEVRIFTKIQAENFLPSDFFDLNLDQRNDIFYEFFKEADGCNLGDILSLTGLPDDLIQFLSQHKVYLREWSSEDGGYYDFSQKRIVVREGTDNLFGVLIHEVNHAIQFYYNMPHGGSPEIFSNRKLLQYTVEHYPMLVGIMKYGRFLTEDKLQSLRKSLISGFDRELDNIELARIEAGESENSIRFGDNLRYIQEAVYLLLNSEIYARTYAHNKVSHGFSLVGNTIITPDGKNFVVYDQLDADEDFHPSSLTPAMSEAIAYNALEQSILSAIDTIFVGDRNKNVRNTYHARLSNYDSGEIIDALITENISPFEKNRLTINDIILNPQRYCNEKIMDMLDGEYDEGIVYSVIRTYIEETFGNVSVDIEAGSHLYILVDDNSFDDLYNSVTRVRTESTQSLYVERYRNLYKKDAPTLRSFYKTNVLDAIGIDPDIKILVGDSYKTQTQVNEDGEVVIYINSKTRGRYRTDAEFLNTLNHEFRHALQLTFGFAYGFTPDFKVTDEMIKDFKEHAPNVFKDKILIERLKRNGLSGKDADIWIVQHAIYILTSGELNATGVLADMILSKPFLVDREGGKFKIFTSWYDANTGKGLYETEYLANRSDDETFDETDEQKPAKKSTKKVEPIKEVRRKLVERRLNTLVDQYLKEHKGSEKMKNTVREFILSDSDVLIENIESLEKKENLDKKDKSQLDFYREVSTARLEILQKVQKYAEEIANESAKESRKRYAVKKDEEIKTHSDEELMLKSIEKKQKDRASFKNTNFVVEINKNSLHDRLLARFGGRVVISKKRAGDTNLKNYIGKRLSGVAAAFIEATTGIEDQLPPDLVHSVKRGYVNRQNLYRWVQEVDMKVLIKYPKAFELVNDILFDNNPYIQSAEELQRIIEETPETYYALAIVLREAGIKDEELFKTADIPTLIEYLTKLDSSWAKRIDFYKSTFYPKNVDPNNEVIRGYMRVCALEWYDKTIIGGAYFANQSKIAYGRWNAGKKTIMSTDITKEGKDGDNMEVQIADTDDESYENMVNSSTEEIAGPGNSIIRLYEADLKRYDDKSEEDMKNELTVAKLERMVENYLSKQTNLSEKAKEEIENYLLGEESLLVDAIGKIRDKGEWSEKDLRRLRFLEKVSEKRKYFYEKLIDYQYRLEKKTFDELSILYSTYRLSEITDTPVDERVEGTSKVSKNDRANTQGRFKRAANRIIRYITDKNIDFSWKDIPEDVKEFFVVEEKDGEKVYSINKNAYLVGHNPTKLSSVDFGKGMQYSAKRNLNEEYDLSSDRTRLILNESRIKEFLKEANSLVKERANLKESMEKKSQQLDEKLREPEKKKVETRADENGNEIYTTEIKTEKKTRNKKVRVQRTGNTPKYFNIHAEKPMPKVLETILDTSFTDLRDTLVQYVTKDKDGNLLTKENNNKEFESSVQHEKVNWEKFYELNRVELNNLTRSEALNIIDFVNSAPFTLSDLNSNLLAFLSFVTAYIVEGAKFNHHNWNFSDSEVAMCEETFQSISHSAGLLLNTVRQMQDVINPYRKVSQRSLDNFGIHEEDLDPLYKAIDKLQKSYTKAAIEKYSLEVMEEIKKLEERMTNPLGEKKWARVWSEIKSFRYLFMLSSPVTWVRNYVSNLFLRSFNSMSDAIGNLFFAKKGYQESSWDLTRKTKVDSDVEAFIKSEILDNKIFDPLFENQSKYDTRSTKNNTKDTFKKMIVEAIKNKYMAENRFDSKTMNRIQGFVNRAISDKSFIRNAATKYLGKILTIEKSRGKVDLSKGLSNEVLSLFAEAVILSSSEYMHKTSLLTNAIEGLKSNHPLAYEVLTFWQPFLNSGFNWFTEFLKYSPMGLVSSIIRLSKLEKQIAAVEARRANGETIADPRAAEFLLRRDIGKGTIGLILTVAGIFLALAGMLRIEDDDEKIYMYIKDMKVDISSLFGSSSLLAGAAIIQPIVNDDASFEDSIASFTEAALKGFVINDILSRHRYDDNIFDFLTVETESAMKSFVPQMVQLFIRFTNNDKIHYSPGVLGGIERWLNSFVPTQPFGTRVVNIYTGEIQSKYNLPFWGQLGASGLGLSIKFYDGSLSATEDFAISNNVNKGEIGNTIKIDEKEYTLDAQKVNIKYGKLNSDTLLNLQKQKHNVQMEDGTYKTLSWNKLSEKQKERVIERTMTRNAQIAKIYYWTEELGHKYYASDSMWTELRKYGITKNVYKGDKGFVE